MSEIKYNEKLNELRIITTVENRDPIMVFLDGQVYCWTTNSVNMSDDCSLKVEELENATNEFGKEIKITFSMPNLKDNYRIVNGFVFVNAKYEQCFKQDKSKVTSFVDFEEEFRFNRFNDEVINKLTYLMSGIKEYVRDSDVLKVFKFVSSYHEYENLTERDFKEIEEQFDIDNKPNHRAIVTIKQNEIDWDFVEMAIEYNNSLTVSDDKKQLIIDGTIIHVGGLISKVNMRPKDEDFIYLLNY